MKPVSLLIILAIILAGLLVFTPFSIKEMFGSFPLFQVISQERAATMTRAPIFRTIDGGTTWFPQASLSATEALPAFNVLDLKLDVQDSTIVYAGTEGNGLYRSFNNGQNWEKVADRNNVLSPGASVYKIVQDRFNINNIYIAAFQNKFGVFLKSTDGGISFNQTYISQLENYPLEAIAINASSSNIIYAGTAQGGFLISQDYGETWKVAEWLTAQIADIVVNPGNASEIYMTTKNRGLFRSVDGGYTWKNFSKELSKVGGTGNIKMLRIDQSNASTLYLALASGLVQSENRGATWKYAAILIPPRALPVDSVAIDPTNSKNIFVGVGNLIYKSQDGGTNWSVQKLNAEKRIARILIDSKNPQSVFLGMKSAKEQNKQSF